MYESEATKFLKELLAHNPQLEEQRRKLRATWWDRPQDLETVTGVDFRLLTIYRYASSMYQSKEKR